jgi:hypothetical protein
MKVYNQNPAAVSSLLSKGPRGVNDTPEAQSALQAQPASGSRDSTAAASAGTAMVARAAQELGSLVDLVMTAGEEPRGVDDVKAAVKAGSHRPDIEGLADKLLAEL